jgi:hypothetical protein
MEIGKILKSLKESKRVDVTKSVKLLARVRTQLNKELGKLEDYHTGIPIEKINSILIKYDCKLINEDGTDFEAIFSGNQGRAEIELAYNNADTSGSVVKQLMSQVQEDCQYVKGSCLILSWYRMESGRYEIVVYIS